MSPGAREYYYSSAKFYFGETDNFGMLRPGGGSHVEVLDDEYFEEHLQGREIFLLLKFRMVFSSDKNLLYSIDYSYGIFKMYDMAAVSINDVFTVCR